jgi:hypothetical protein
MNLRIFPLFCLLLLCPMLAHAGCVSPSQAPRYVGETKCVTGKVIAIERGNDGAHYLEFCEDSKSCSFVAVIFPEDLRHIGDVRQLKGKLIEVHGDVKEYDSGTEIVVSESRQLKGEATSIPPLPKAYDVEKKGRYSSGTFSHPKTYSTTRKRQPAKLPLSIPEDSSD